MVNIRRYDVLVLSGFMFSCTHSFAGGAGLLDTPSMEPAYEIKDESLITQAEPVVEDDSSITRYKESIQELEGKFGVYHHQIREELLGLGLNYKAQGRYQEALDVFNRSLHITRVNKGLYHFDQVPILKLLIETNKSLEKWEELNKNYNYLFWLQKRNYGDKDVRLLSSIDNIGRWHLEAYSKSPTGLDHLFEADELYDKAIEIIELNYGPEDPRIINALYGSAITNQLIAELYCNNIELCEFKGRLNLKYDRMSNRRRRLSQSVLWKEDKMLRSYGKGKKAMVRIVDIHANNTDLNADAHAIAMTHLGDWYLLFNRRNSAMQSYKEAYQILSNAGTAEEDINSFFSSPRSLPTVKIKIQEDDPPENTDVYVLASFDVSPSGKVQNIRIIEANPPDNTRNQSRAKNHIKATRFRPRLENGEPVATKDVNIRYIFDN